jgi:putative membrane protein
VSNIISGRVGVAALIAALGAFACALPNKTATTAAAEMSEPMSSGEILQVLQAINEGEIEQAQLALQRSRDPEVQSTARLILQDHEASNERIAAVAQATRAELNASPLSRGVALQSSQIKDKLEGLSGEAFDREYLRRQADMHRVALDTVRTQLLPNAKEPQVRQLLEQATPKLEQHLHHAERSMDETASR